MRRAKPICQACHRPFDPRSPGATPWMGPTCARRAGAARNLLDLDQLGFPLDFVEPVPVPPPPPRPAPRHLPRRFDERQKLAKLAFDELYREFCPRAPSLVGADAEALERSVNARGARIYSLSDPALAWLEPEHDLALVIEGDQTYYRRRLNGVLTLLAIEPASSAAARAHVETITAFARDLERHCAEIAVTQPPLAEL